MLRKKEADCDHIVEMIKMMNASMRSLVIQKKKLSSKNRKKHPNPKNPQPVIIEPSFCRSPPSSAVSRSVPVVKRQKEDIKLQFILLIYVSIERET
ncbi:hypothetical protein L6452_32684 [Arctium lappa]|uniref:Uncharacterized protein n=1 Tax=Arctium lappa TaxID=4217 RepID=A0ACB8Z9L4_ARCLA|nr:hypothetical protein L6452_32684 [Arctium lappa]